MGVAKIIAASAGSGKTYRLAYDYVRTVVENPTMYRHILAVTFTNKATEEMRSRVLLRLHELADPGVARPQYLKQLLEDLPLSEKQIRQRALDAQTRILHDYGRFAVLTIDRFFQRLIRAFIRELGVDVNFGIELETDSVLAQAADALIDESADDPRLRKRLDAAAAERLADGRGWNVRESLVELGRELFGERWRRAPENASSLIDTVVQRAREVRTIYKERARAMLSSLEARGLGTDDFRGKSKGLFPWLGRAAKGEWKPMNSYVKAEITNVEGLAELAEIYDANARLINSAALLRDNHHNFLLLSDLQSRIERICRERNILPISETNRIIARLVAGNDAPFIFEKAGGWFARYFIDEFQDTSTAQWENFVPLVDNALASETGDAVMLIGDVKQAIYRWRGGDWRILSRRVGSELPQVETETLTTNRRSALGVVEFNNRVTGLLVEAGNRQLNDLLAEAATKGDISRTQAAELTDLLAEAYRDHAQTATKEGGHVTFSTYEDAPPLVEKVEELLARGWPRGDIAVLVRTNAQAALAAETLLAKGHQVVTQEALRVGAAAVSRFIISVLALAADPSDSVQRAIYNHWLGREFDAPLTDERFLNRLAGLSPEEAFEETVLRFGLASRARDIAYIQALHQQIVTFSARQVADTPLFLEWWSERGAAASIAMQQGADAITVSTIHKAKGLEYPAVIVPWLGWPLGVETRGRRQFVWTSGEPEALGELGAVPINFKKEMAQSHFAAGYYRESVMAHIDAMNLFYVAVTRAETELHLMASTARSVPANSVGTALQAALGASNYAIGSPFEPPHKAPGTSGLRRFASFSAYPTARPGAKVRMRISNERQTGVSMHSAMERAASMDDVCRVLGRVPGSPQVKEWFDAARWDEIRTEGAIVVPGGEPSRRPDRVMIRGDRAVVVDYKFGRVERPEYAAQLREYAALLERMGYRTEACIWYASLDKVVAV